MLHLDQLCLGFGPELLFENVNMQVDKGAICCIKTGVLDGSTSLLKCIAGIQQTVSGSCRLKGIPLYDYSKVQLLELVCFCYEEGGLVSLFSVYENIVLPLVYHHNVQPTALEQRVGEIAEALFISDCLHKRVHQLNDVQTRLVNLARALVLGAELVLIDELQEGMSAQMRQAVLAYLLAHSRENKLTLIMTTTGGDETAFADRVFFIEDKSVRESN